MGKYVAACLHCGSADLKPMSSKVVIDFVYLQCGGCSNSSASAASIKAALADWNWHNQKTTDKDR